MLSTFVHVSSVVLRVFEELARLYLPSVGVIVMLFVVVIE